MCSHYQLSTGECKRRRGTRRSLQTCNSRLWGHWRSSDRLLSARDSRIGSFRLSFIGKAPCRCTRERTQSSGVKWTDSGRLLITTTRLKSGSANTSRGRGVRKPGSRTCACCSGTFYCPTLLATTWHKTISCTFGIFRGVRGRLKLRKLERNSCRKKPRSRRTPVAVWIFIKLIDLGRHCKCIFAKICKPAICP